MRPALSRVAAHRPLLLDFLAPRSLGRIRIQTESQNGNGNGLPATLRFKHASATQAQAQVTAEDARARDIPPHLVKSRRDRAPPSPSPSTQTRTRTNAPPTPPTQKQKQKQKPSKPKNTTPPLPQQQKPSPSAPAAENASLDDAHSLVRLLRDAAARGDVLAVLSAYSALQHNTRWVALNAQNYGAISRMLLAEYSDLARHTFRAPAQAQAAVDLALECARAGNTDGVRQIMIWHLARGELGKVVGLFGRFEREVLKTESEAGKEVEAGKEAEAEGEVLRVEDLEETNVQGISHVLMCTLAAYALRDDFASALQMVLRHDAFKTSASWVRVFERDLRSCQRILATEEKEKIQAFADAADVARLMGRPGPLRVHLRNIATSKNAGETLEGLAKSMLDGFEGPLGWAAASEEDVSQTRPVVVTEKVWSYVIYEMVLARQEELAQETWMQILRLGYKPTLVLWNALLEGYRDTFQLTKLRNAWRVMKTQGVEPDAASYTALIGCLFAQRSRGGALQSFEEYKKFAKGDDDAILVYNTVINGYLSERDTAGATKLLDDMRTNGPPPDLVTYNTFIKHYAQKGDLRGVATVVAQLVESGLEPDVFTYTTLLNGLFNARVRDATDQLLALMHKMGVKASVATYSTLIDAQVREGTREAVRAAWRLLDELEHMKDVKPNIVTYTSVLAGIHRSAELGKDEVLRMSRDVLARIHKRRLRLRLGTYHILLKTALDNPSPEGITCFLTYYEMLTKEGIPFWHDTWYIILNGLVKRNEWKLASRMKSDMLKSQFEPMWGVLEAVKMINVWELKRIK